MPVDTSVFQRLSVLSLVMLTLPALASESADLSTINRILDEGFNRSELPETAAYLTDQIGGRLTNSPQMRHAEHWTQERFRTWGLSNVRAEGFEFGRGWSIEQVSVRMITPRVRPMHGIPIAWTPPTDGAVAAEIIVAPLRDVRDFAKWRGKLRGRIVLTNVPGTGNEPDEPVFKRYTDAALSELDEFELPHSDEAERAKRVERVAFEAKRDAFLAEEGARMFVRISTRDGGLVHGATYGADSYTAYGFRPHQQRPVPGVELAAEDYRLLARLVKVGAAPKLEVVSEVRFHDEDVNAYNILADLPGEEPSAGYVMAGAHLDSWVAADGASDNAAGVAIVMEAARILIKLGVKPKRTIRFALWNAEEQGMLGSLNYVERHLATRASLNDLDIARLSPYFSRAWMHRWPIEPKQGHEQLIAYFNFDNGSGKVRGIYTEGNVAVVPIFKSWLAPFASMGANTVAAKGTTGTDHVIMQAVGVPGFQFIQDPLDYRGRSGHTNVDTYDHLKIADMKQATVILAAFLLQAANREAPLPRMPVPTRPKPSDPFAYDEE